MKNIITIKLDNINQNNSKNNNNKAYNTKKKA